MTKRRLSQPDMGDYAATIELLRNPGMRDGAIAMYAQDIVRPGSSYEYQGTGGPLTYLWQELRNMQEEEIVAALAAIAVLHENIWGEGPHPRPH